MRAALRGYQSQAQQPAPNKQQSKRRAAHYPGGRTLKDVHAERGAHLFRTFPRSLSLAFLCSLLSAAQQRLDGKLSHAVSGARWSESGGDKRARSVWLSGGSGGAMAGPAPALGSNLAPHPLVLKPAFGVTKPPLRLVSFQSRVRPPRRRGSRWWIAMTQSPLIRASHQKAWASTPWKSTFRATRSTRRSSKSEDARTPAPSPHRASKRVSARGRPSVSFCP